MPSSTQDQSGTRGWDAPLRVKLRNYAGRAVRGVFVALFKAVAAASRALGADRYFARIVRQTRPFGLLVHPADDFYAPMPDRDRLKTTQHRWCRPSEMVGVAYDLDAMHERLSKLTDAYGDEWSRFDYRQDMHAGFGPGFTEIDAMLLYMTLRDLKPQRYLEVGSGLSTYYALRANARNREEGHAAQMTCIDPFPFDRLKAESDVRILVQEVQDTAFSVFEELEAGDVLMIDSTHIVRVDGDVPFLLLEVLPRLKPGVIVHVHDIPFPYNVPYPPGPHIFDREWPRYFNEPMLLQAFLAFNDRFNIRLSVPMLIHFDEPFLRRIVPGYNWSSHLDGYPPCSVWLERVK